MDYTKLMKVRHVVWSLVLAVITAGSIYILNSGYPDVRAPAATPTPVGVLSAATGSGKCQARWVDQSDPQAYLPDAGCTPGVADAAVTQANIMTTICVPGYTATVRPPVAYTNNLKKQQIADYGYTDTNVKDYEEDHLISLELGGSPTDPKNLWPEPHPSVNEKDKVENYLHEQVCSGKMTLEEAQKEISGDWYEVFKNFPAL